MTDLIMEHALAGLRLATENVANLGCRANGPMSYDYCVISTRELTSLPSIAKLNRLTKSLAVLDAIIEAEWEYRHYSFNSKWGVGQEVASMRNGQGDEWFCVFSSVGVFLKGFDHESKMSPWSTEGRRVWPGVLDQIPEEFVLFAKERQRNRC